METDGQPLDYVSDVDLPSDTITTIRRRFVTTDRVAETIKDAYLELLANHPDRNPRDLWFTDLRRIYEDYKMEEEFENGGKSLKQAGVSADNSWRSASGDAFERFMAEWMTDQLPAHIRMTTLSDTQKDAIIERIDARGEVGEYKMDLAIDVQHDGDWYLVGCPHAKTSLRERLSEDAVTSEVAMQRGLFSPAVTMDNGDELGTSTDSLESRELIEDRGKFSNLYSLNTETTPTPAGVSAEAAVKVVDVTAETNVLVEDIVAHVESLDTTELMKYPSV